MSDLDFLIEIIKENFVAGIIFAIWLFQYRETSKNTRELIQELKDNNKMTADKFDKSIDKITESLNQQQIRLASIEAKIDSRKGEKHE